MCARPGASWPHSAPSRLVKATPSLARRVVDSVPDAFLDRYFPKISYGRCAGLGTVSTLDSRVMSRSLGRDSCLASQDMIQTDDSVRLSLTKYMGTPSMVLSAAARIKPKGNVMATTNDPSTRGIS